MLSFKERQEFYQQTKFLLKDKPQWRLFKIELGSGKWETIPNQIRNGKQLRKILIKKAPINVYSSCSLWLNPLKIEHPSYIYADALFLGNDVFIDIDEHNENTYYDIINWFKKHPRYKFIRAVDSGEGFHLYYKDTNKIEEKDPLKRYKLVKKEREHLVDELIDAKLDVDFDMTKDLLRISRVIGTLNDGSKPCTLLHDPQLRIGSERLLLKPMNVNNNSEYREGARSEPSAPFKYLCWNFIDVQVEGVNDRYCVFIRKDKNMLRLKTFINKIRDLQKIYKLPAFYIYKTYNTYEALCPKAVTFSRALKIIKCIKSKNYGAFKKYRHYWIRTSSLKNTEDLSIFDNTPQFIEKVESDYEGDIFSRPHCDYISHNINSLGRGTLAKEVVYPLSLIGNKKNKIKTAFAKIPIKKNVDR